MRLSYCASTIFLYFFIIKSSICFLAHGNCDKSLSHSNGECDALEKAKTDSELISVDNAFKNNVGISETRVTMSRYHLGTENSRIYKERSSRRSEREARHYAAQAGSTRGDRVEVNPARAIRDLRIRFETNVFERSLRTNPLNVERRSISRRRIDSTNAERRVFGSGNRQLTRTERFDETRSHNEIQRDPSTTPSEARRSEERSLERMQRDVQNMRRETLVREVNMSRRTSLSEEISTEREDASRRQNRLDEVVSQRSIGRIADRQLLTRSRRDFNRRSTEENNSNRRAEVIRSDRLSRVEKEIISDQGRQISRIHQRRIESTSDRAVITNRILGYNRLKDFRESGVDNAQRRTGTEINTVRDIRNRRVEPLSRGINNRNIELFEIRDNQRQYVQGESTEQRKTVRGNRARIVSALTSERENFMTKNRIRGMSLKDNRQSNSEKSNIRNNVNRREELVLVENRSVRLQDERFEKRPVASQRRMDESRILNNRRTEDRRVSNERSDISERRVNDQRKSDNRLNARRISYGLRTDEYRLLNERAVMHERRMGKRRVDERRADEKRVDERRVDERRVDERRVDERRVDERWVDKRRVDENRVQKRWVDERQVDERRADERRVDERRVDERRVDERRVDERRIDERRVDERRVGESTGLSIDRVDLKRSERRVSNERRMDEKSVPMGERREIRARQNERMSLSESRLTTHERRNDERKVSRDRHNDERRILLIERRRGHDYRVSANRRLDERRDLNEQRIASSDRQMSERRASDERQIDERLMPNERRMFLNKLPIMSNERRNLDERRSLSQRRQMGRLDVTREIQNNQERDSNRETLFSNRREKVERQMDVFGNMHTIPKNDKSIFLGLASGKVLQVLLVSMITIHMIYKALDAKTETKLKNFLFGGIPIVKQKFI